MANAYETVIGLECHVELSTDTKMFCGCRNAFGSPPNSNVCPVCLGLPGSLPVPNERAIESIVRIGLALGSTIAPGSLFHRKNYFYPDMPKDYQITQYDRPINLAGRLDLPSGLRVGITRAHLEEDTGKSTHVGTSGRIHGAEHSLIDYNRAGVPLLEVVSEPDIRTADQAREYVAELRAVLLAVGASDAKMEEGSMRVDANVSVRRPGDEFGTRCEIKNVNSVRSLGRAIEFEARRQIDLIESGDRVRQQTRHWNENDGRTHTLRTKEDADDYRYFPEPDLVPVKPQSELVETLRAELPELPASRIRRIEKELDLERATVLVTGGLDRLWQDTVAAGADAVAAANVVANNLVGAGVAVSAVPAGELARLVEARDRIPRAAFDEAIAKLGEPGFVADSYLAREAVSDIAALEPIVDAVLEANPGQVAAYRGGKEGLLGFFVGQVMKKTEGKANARVVSELVRAKLAD
jgi:aspartyl-tRNA(Asn)/glutamyl-tRNA(Gln) amidotransferase subunit B